MTESIAYRGNRSVSSTSSGYQSTNRSQPGSYEKPRRQYASNEPHVEYILVASFDIDRGPIMEHQYPGAISSDESMLAELMLPDQTHVRKQDWTMFFLHKEEITIEDSDSDEEMESPLMYVLNLVNTKQDATVKRGAIVKAMAICTRHSFLHIYKPLLLLALEDYFKNPGIQTLELLYNSLNSMDLSALPKLSVLERNILQATDTKDMFRERFGEILRDTHEFETKIVYNEIPIPVKIPTALMSETVGDFSIITLLQTFGNPHLTSPQAFTLHPHLTTSGPYTHPILVLINAMLTQKRVIFLGHNRPSAEVSEAVVAACALASGGILRGFTRHAFPYTDLTKIDELLKVPGFIAGVTNPAFSYHPEWWDLLCDLPSGRMKISTSIESAPITEGTTYFQQHHHPTNGSHDPDMMFMEDINSSIASRQGEAIIRAKFRAYIMKFTRIAATFEELVYGASNLTVPIEKNGKYNDNVKGHGYVWSTEENKYRELSASASRIEGWRNTRSYYTFTSDLAKESQLKKKRHIDIYHCLSKLRKLRLPPQDAGAIYLALREYCDDYESILELLNNTPMSEAGLFYVSLGLWHEDAKVREATTALLSRVKHHPAGKIFFQRLGGWVHTGLGED